jgi:pimeloyl-ACP methyl ester carboxylesterase
MNAKNLPSAAAVPATANAAGSPVQVHYRTMEVQGVEVFYREAGAADAPTVLLLHGFGASSHMFRELIPQLAGKYHVIAPDWPDHRHPRY